jgi:hypothetical protein
VEDRDEHREHGFAEGQDRGPHTEEEEHEGRFSEGQEATPETPTKEHHHGRFSGRTAVRPCSASQATDFRKVSSIGV